MQITVDSQVFYNYGNRSNKYLLLNYGFCFANNSYDSVLVYCIKDLVSLETYQGAKQIKIKKD